jgi:bacteriocin biosynthesis cyclodehydratase domain-containing protein
MSQAPRERLPPATRTSTGRLRVLPHYAIPTAGGELQLRTARQNLLLRGAAARDLLPKVLPLLDGTLTESEISTRLAPLSRGNLRALLELLDEHSLLSEESGPAPTQPETNARYFQFVTGSRHETPQRLANASILIVDATTHGGLLDAALQSCGVGRRTRIPVIACPESDAAWRDQFSGWDAVTLLVQGPAVLVPWLAAYNRALVNSGRIGYVLSLLGDDAVQLGPTLVPRQTACLGCLLDHFERTTALLDGIGFRERWLSQMALESARSTPRTARLGANLAALDLVHAFTPWPSSKTVGQLLTVDLRSLRTKTFRFPRLPRCRACGRGDRPPDKVWG